MSKLDRCYGALNSFRAEVHNRRMAETEENLQGAIVGAFSAFTTPMSNIHATGIGIREKDGEFDPNDFVLKVFVFNKVDLGSDTPDIMKKFQDVEVDVEELPIQMAAPVLAAAPQASTTPAQHQQKQRPIPGGVQVSPQSQNYVGTLGCFVQQQGQEQVFALSNNHVLANTNILPIGTTIHQPFTGSNNAFASLTDYEKILFPGPGSSPTNHMDAAIAAVSDNSLVKLGSMFGIPNYSPGIKAAAPGMSVTKSGRTTGVTKGVVKATNVNGVLVNYGTPQMPKIAKFDSCIEIVNPSGGSFSKPGDSGSVILEVSSGVPVALLFAGDFVTTTACDLLAVCQRFNVKPV